MWSSSSEAAQPLCTPIAWPWTPVFGKGAWLAIPLTTAGAWHRGGACDPSWDNGVLLLLLLFLLLRPPWGTRCLGMSHTEDSGAAGREGVTDCPGDTVQSLAHSPQLCLTVHLHTPNTRPFRFKKTSLTSVHS